MNAHPADRTDQLGIAFDLDGTLAQSLWTPENKTREIGPIIPSGYDKVIEAYELGWKCFIHTSRPASDRPNIWQWLGSYELQHVFQDIDHVITDKFLAELYVDDKARHNTAASWLPPRHYPARMVG